MRCSKLTMLALPYSRLEFPGWGKILRLLGVFEDNKWKNAPKRIIRGKLHGYLMKLDLSDWSDRHAYFLGRFYDLPLQLLIKSLVQKGDSFVDVGANIGMITLLASHQVGPDGQIFAFEPNPEAIKRLKEHIMINNIRNVKLYEFGLSDKSEELILNVLTKHTGMSTFAKVPKKDIDLISKRYGCKVAKGDKILSKNFEV